MIGRLDSSITHLLNHSILIVALCVLSVFGELCELYEFGEFGGEGFCLVGEEVCATVCAVASYD